MFSLMRRSTLLQHPSRSFETVSLMAARKAKKGSNKREVFSTARKGTKEYVKVQEKNMTRKREIKEKKFFGENSPRFVSAMLFGCAIPQSFLLYKMIWADGCSDEFFDAFEFSCGWIASISALEGAAAVALGLIDYKVKQNNLDMIVAMRKKRLAFSKFSFIMAIGALLLIDTPSPNAVLPLIIGQGWTTLKLGTQIGHNLTPERFFIGRTFLSGYNLALLIGIWYKLRQARREKMDLEFSFFQRVEGIMLTMSNVFEDKTFGAAAAEDRL